MGKNHRPDRLGGEIKKLISELLINGVKDPRLVENMISISAVEVTNDGSYAFCYVNVFTTSEEEEENNKLKADVIKGLNSAKGMFKKELSKAVKIRRLPELVFKIDEAAEYGRHIDDLLKTIDFDSYNAVDPNEEKGKE